MSDKPAVTTKNTVATKTPLGEQQPFFSDIWSKTGQAVQDFSPFSGNVVAAPNELQQRAVGQISGAPVGTNAGATADMAHKVASGFFLDPSNDPTFVGAVGAAINPITKALQEHILPGIVDKSIRAGGTGTGPGAYGGSAQDLQENQAVENWAKQASDTAAAMANASRTAGMGLTSLIPGLNTAANAEALAPGQASLSAGTLQGALDQSVLDNELQKWQLNQNSLLPFLQQAASVLNTGGFGTSTSDTTETGAAPSLATQWLQGLTGGAGIANSLFGAPAGGTSAFSGIMGALSMLSDRRLKSDIRPWGIAGNGLPLYRYRYLGAGPEFIGPMADECRAGVSYHYGYAQVNYAEALGV